MGCTTSSQALAPKQPNSLMVRESAQQQLGEAQNQPSSQAHVQINAPALIVSTPKMDTQQQKKGDNVINNDHHEDVENLMVNSDNSLEPKSRTASASSVVSNISTASKGIAYEFKLNDGGGSIVKAHPPKALKRLEMSADMKLTFEQLSSQLNNAEQRKTKLLIERQDRIKTMSSGRAPIRPKTAAPQNVGGQGKLEKSLAEAEERKKKVNEDVQKKQQDKDARARRVRERAKNLQNPEFVNKMDTFGPEGNLEAPLSPMPAIKNHVDSFVVESENPNKEEKDNFFE